ncbi:MAG: pyridoxamine 5'-phosphate oxidase family protein, partial [Candidatus Aminicenantes bacterium]|nr:pyridoxamine 5'-phosphate oxidase family protein [Candidatus Aminicenantes bacterium]
CRLHNNAPDLSFTINSNDCFLGTFSLKWFFKVLEQAKEIHRMEKYHGLRRQEQEIRDSAELKAILAKTQYVTVAMCKDNEPYLVTLSHGYDEKQNAIYFHCAFAGKKIDFLKANNRVWGQALVDRGYVQGSCDHLFSSVQFSGRVSFVADEAEKGRALAVMIRQLEQEPEKVMAAKVTAAAVAKTCIGRIDIEFLSGKRSEKAAAVT